MARTKSTTAKVANALEFRLQVVDDGGDYAAGEFLPRVYHSRHAAMVAQQLHNTNFDPPVRAVVASVTLDEVVREAEF